MRIRAGGGGILERTGARIRGPVGRLISWVDRTGGPGGEVISQAIEREMTRMGRLEQVADRFQELRNRVVAEFVVKEQKKEKKTKEQMKAIEVQFEQTGHNPIEFITDVLGREDESFEALTTDVRGSAEALGDFLSGYDIEMTEQDLVKFDNEQGRRKQAQYKDAVKKQKGFLSYLFDLVFSLYKE